MKQPQNYPMQQKDLLKVFPEAYYTKYANHLKILQFEKIIMSQDTNKTQINFKQRNNIRESRIRSAIPKTQLRKVKISQYDTYEEIIQKNKQQLKRIKKCNTILEMKLKIKPDKRNVISSPEKLQITFKQDDFMKLKAIEDMQFQRKQKLRKQKKIQLQKSAICRFVKKCKSAKIISNSRLPQSARVNPQSKTKTQRQLALKLQQIAMESLERNSSIHLNSSRVIQRDAQFINNINTAIKKSSDVLKKAGITPRQQQKVLKLFKQRTHSKTSFGYRGYSKQKKNLIQQTKRIRQQTKQMLTLKRYDIILQKKAAKQNLDKL